MAQSQKELPVIHHAALATLRSRRFYQLYILGLLLIYCTLFYYFGEIVDFFGWGSLRWDFFYGVHDVHRLFFLAPIVYAGYCFGVRASIIITIIVANIFLPRALFISPYPDPLLRAMLFIVIAGVLGYLVARVQNESKRRARLEALLRKERDRMMGILERMVDGVIITGSDYRVRYLNPSMIKNFSEGIDSYCYEYLHKRDSPCPDICQLSNVLKGEVVRWEYTFPDGRTYEIVASPYIDADGTVCQLAIFRNITQRKKTS